MEEDTAVEGDDDDLEGYSWQCGTLRFILFLYFYLFIIIVFVFFCC